MFHKDLPVTPRLLGITWLLETLNTTPQSAYGSASPMTFAVHKPHTWCKLGVQGLLSMLGRNSQRRIFPPALGRYFRKENSPSGDTCPCLDHTRSTDIYPHHDPLFWRGPWGGGMTSGCSHITSTRCQPGWGPQSPEPNQGCPGARDGLGHAANSSREAGYFPGCSIDYSDCWRQGWKWAPGTAWARRWDCWLRSAAAPLAAGWMFRSLSCLGNYQARAWQSRQHETKLVHKFTGQGLMNS